MCNVVEQLEKKKSCKKFSGWNKIGRDQGWAAQSECLGQGLLGKREKYYVVTAFSELGNLK